MMTKMTKQMSDVMKNTNDKQKIRLFYELGKYIKENAGETDDDEMNNLFDDIANVVNDIENL